MKYNYSYDQKQKPHVDSELSNYDIMNNYLLRVVALGNLLIFVIADHQFIILPAFSWYLAVVIFLTELIYIVDSYSNIVIHRRQQPNFRPWPASTSLMRGMYHHMIYHIYFMNVLLFIVVFGQGWEYTNYFCGVCYSGLILLTL